MASTIINNKYRVTRRIGGGSFGEIYMGITNSGDKVAIKFERMGARCPQLRHEYKVYRELVNSIGIARIYYFGSHDNYNVMVMDMLGLSLEDLFNKCSRRFSLKTVLQLADQMLERVDTLHARHLIHRDIKPANFVIGSEETKNRVYAVDFGLSKRYRHPKTLQHIPHREGRSLTGTPRYASINNHLGIEQSRRDDLESVGYVLVYFLKGSLPWQGLKAKNANKKYRLIMERKQSVPISQLCQGLPSQFAEFLTYCRSLQFDAKPDIPYLRKLFNDLYEDQGFHTQNQGSTLTWDWDFLEGEKKQQEKQQQQQQQQQLEVEEKKEERKEERKIQEQSTHLNKQDVYQPSTSRHAYLTSSSSNNQFQQRPTTSGAVLEGGLTKSSSNIPTSQVHPFYPTQSQQQTKQSIVNTQEEKEEKKEEYNTTALFPTNEINYGQGFTQNNNNDSKASFPNSGSIDRSRNNSHVSSQVEEEGHVVAGARAMMRYRKQRNFPPSLNKQHSLSSSQSRRSKTSTGDDSKKWDMNNPYLYRPSSSSQHSTQKHDQSSKDRKTTSYSQQQQQQQQQQRYSNERGNLSSRLFPSNRPTTSTTTATSSSKDNPYSSRHYYSSREDSNTRRRTNGTTTSNMRTNNRSSSSSSSSRDQPRYAKKTSSSSHGYHHVKRTNRSTKDQTTSSSWRERNKSSSSSSSFLPRNRESTYTASRYSNPTYSSTRTTTRPTVSSAYGSLKSKIMRKGSSR